MNKQYVQHISGQGGKWEVVPDRSGPYHWNCFSIYHELWLPKSEYCLCEPPERWVDVTAECEATSNWPNEKYSRANGISVNNTMLWIPCEIHNDGYRLRKVRLLKSLKPFEHQWAFIVEKKQDQ